MSKDTPELDFSALWQQQPVHEIDLTDITQRLKHQQRIQRWYIVSDFSGFFFGFGALVYSWDKIPEYLALILCGVVVSAGVFTAYLVWLRRHAVLASFEDTSHYRETLKKQYQSNQKIARVTMHSSWTSLLGMVIIWGIAAGVGELTWQKFVDNKGIETFIVVSIVMAGFGWWAYKRELKFKREYERLISQEQNDLLL
jgi:hypothetical protein